MKSIVFDSGIVITFAINSILWLFSELKRKYRGQFLMPGAVAYEIVDKPLTTKKFKFEALQVKRELRQGTFLVVKDKRIVGLGKRLTEIANNSFFAHDHPIAIVHRGEMECVACVLERKSEALAIDERTTRVLVEKPLNLHRLLERKLHTKVRIDKSRLEEWKDLTSGIRIIRSAELVTVAYKLGLLDRYHLKDNRNVLLDSLLWGVKLNGCSLSVKEIEAIKKSEM